MLCLGTCNLLNDISQSISMLKDLCDCFCQLHFETVCKSMMSVYFIGKCAAITQLSLGDLFW